MFKDWFKKKSASEQEPKIYSFEELSQLGFEDVCAYAIKLAQYQDGKAVNCTAGINICRRLIDIAFDDDETTDTNRELAARLEEVMWSQIQSALSSNPSSLKLFENARNSHIESCRHFGAKSLSRKLSKLPHSQVVSELILIDNAHLLPNYPRKTVASQRGSILYELLKNRAEEQLKNTWFGNQNNSISSLAMTNRVVTAGFLVLTRDPTTMWLLESHERVVLAGYFDHYATARNMLTSIGVPSLAESVVYNASPDANAIADFVLLSCADMTIEKGGAEENRLPVILPAINADSIEEFFSSVTLLRIWIWKKTLVGIFGVAYWETVCTSEKMKVVESVLSIVKTIDDLYELAVKNVGDHVSESKEFGFQYILIAQLFIDYIDRRKPAAETTQTLTACSELLKSELFYFPQFVRYLIAFVGNGNDADVMGNYNEDALV